VPRPGEYVVFSAHFERGLGLPALDFFRRFLDFYELHLLPFFLHCFHGGIRLYHSFCR
jgi:hypothetical protein